MAQVWAGDSTTTWTGSGESGTPWGNTSCGWDDNPWKPRLPGNTQVGGWVGIGGFTGDTGRFSDDPGTVNLDQAHLCARKRADGNLGFDFGFGVDATFGADADESQAFGNNPGNWDFINDADGRDYGWAIPQLYGEVAVGDLSVMAGHFYSILGYEVVTAPDNFFYSHAFTMQNSEPFTHTGVLASYQASDEVAIHGGWTAGWDTGFDQRDGGSNFLGGISVEIPDGASFTYTASAGDTGHRGEGYAHGATVEVDLTDQLQYALHNAVVDLDDGFASRIEYGFSQYLFYQLNSNIGLGGRFDIWNAEGGVDVDDVVPAPGRNTFYSATFGANIRPAANVIIRPEVRHDWSPDAHLVGRPDDNYGETIFGIDAILTY